jgi:hypothetical protein
VGDVAVAREDVDTRIWDCRGGQGCDLCKLGRRLGSGEEQRGDGDASKALGLPVPVLFDPRLPDGRGDGGDALGPIWCRPPFRDLLFCKPDPLPISTRAPS